jgi:GR25 family glycosyltransferase involved in LPS biosynthesis
MIFNVELCLIVTVIVLLVLLVVQHLHKLKLSGNHGDQGETYKNYCTKGGIKLNDVDIYLINMQANSDRLESFIEQYMMSDLRYKKFSRFAAVDGATLDTGAFVTQFALDEINTTLSSGYRTKHYQLTKGAVGCYLSHLSLYNKIAKGDAPYGLIFEDDVRIDSNLFAKINKNLETIPNNWDILLFGCHCIVCDKFEKHYDAERFFLLHAYIVKKESARKIFNYLDKKKIEQQIDSELSDMVTVGQLKIFCLRDTIARQDNRTFRTTIQTPLKMVAGVDPYQSII